MGICGRGPGLPTTKPGSGPVSRQFLFRSECFVLPFQREVPRGACGTPFPQYLQSHLQMPCDQRAKEGSSPSCSLRHHGQSPDGPSDRHSPATDTAQRRTRPSDGHGPALGPNTLFGWVGHRDCDRPSLRLDEREVPIQTQRREGCTQAPVWTLSGCLLRGIPRGPSCHQPSAPKPGLRSTPYQWADLSLGLSGLLQEMGVITPRLARPPRWGSRPKICESSLAAGDPWGDCKPESHGPLSAAPSVVWRSGSRADQSAPGRPPGVKRRPFRAGLDKSRVTRDRSPVLCGGRRPPRGLPAAGRAARLAPGRGRRAEGRLS